MGPADLTHDFRRPAWSGDVYICELCGCADPDESGPWSLEAECPVRVRAVLEAERDEARALLSDALDRQRRPCTHEGIGLPGCATCDPRVRR
jgi:hypothetical protein